MKLMKWLASIVLAASVPMAFAQTSTVYTYQAGITLFASTSATATATSVPVRLPNYNGYGTLNITGVGITGSPSGCTVALAYQGANASAATSAVATISFTPSTGAQQQAVSPSVASGDQYVATYACSVYPTAGRLIVSFSPSQTSSVSGSVTITNSGDPCLNPNVTKSSVSVAISTATTTQLVAISGTKLVYACGFSASIGASTTVGFEYGTGSACGTGTTALTGVYAPATGAVLQVGAGTATMFAAPAGNALCAVSTGTGGINGVLTYVQQ